MTSNRWPVGRDDSAVPDIISWIIGALSIICVFAKIATKVFYRNRRAIDDIFICISLIFSIGMVVTVTVASARGLGEYTDNLDTARFRSFEKSIYSTDILFLFTLIFSKLSMLAVIKLLTCCQFHIRLIWLILVFNALWTLSSVFAVAFQCPVPNTWTILSDKCIDQRVFWTFFDCINILTELSLIAIAAIVVNRVKADRKDKITLHAMFNLRFLVVGAIIASIVYRQRVTRTPNEETFKLYPVQVCRQFVQGLSIILACVPAMLPSYGILTSCTPRISETPPRNSWKIYSPEARHSGGLRHSQLIRNSQARSSTRSRNSMFETIERFASRFGHGPDNRYSNTDASQGDTSVNTIQETISYDIRTETRNQ